MLPVGQTEIGFTFGSQSLLIFERTSALLQRFLHHLAVQVHQGRISIQECENVSPVETVIVTHAFINSANEREIFGCVERPAMATVVTIRPDREYSEARRILIYVRRHMNPLVGLACFLPGTRESLPRHNFRVEAARVRPGKRVARLVGMLI